MTEIKVNGWLPIRIPLRIPDWPSPPDFSECLDQFCLGLVSALPTLNPSIISVEARIIKPPSYVTKDIYTLNGDGWFDPKFYKFLQVQCVMAYDSDQMNVPDESNVEGMLGGLAACDLASTLEDALLLAQLSYPTRIHSVSGRTYLGRYPMNEVSRISGVLHECIWDPALKWPEVKTIPIEKVCEWEAKLGLFKQGVARTPVQRALASFSHLVATKSIHGGETLFWSMQGLESFYCRGSGDLRRQLSEKSRLFLGQWVGLKNIVGSLYDFRSKFVHGDFNLDRWNNNLEPEAEDQKGQEASLSAVLLATRMLLSTLQKCADECITSVEFEYSLKIGH